MKKNIPGIPKSKWSKSRSGQIVQAYQHSNNTDPWVIPIDFYQDGRTTEQIYSALHKYIRNNQLPMDITLRGSEIYLSAKNEGA